MTAGSPDQGTSSSGTPESSNAEDVIEPGATLRSPKETPDQDPLDAWSSLKESDGEFEYEQGVKAGPAVKTEKLYRSANFPDPSVAESPLEPRVKLEAVAAAEPELKAQPAPETSAPASIAKASAAEQMSAPAIIEPMPTPAQGPDQVRPANEPARAPSAKERGINSVGVFLIITVVTAGVGLVDMSMNRRLTWITGAAFVVASIITALAVRRRDLWTAVIWPPLAFLVALLIAGQPSTLSSSGSLVFREASLIATGLAFNAPFIFGGTAAALVIVLIRRAGSK